MVCALTCRVLTFTYVALLFGLMGYGIPFEGVEGFRSRNNILFVTNLNTMLFPYISISLFTSDKRIYLADASAKRYRPGAYYVAKVRTRTVCHHTHCPGIDAHMTYRTVRGIAMFLGRAGLAHHCVLLYVFCRC